MSTFFSKENSWYIGKKMGTSPTRIDMVYIISNSHSYLDAFWRSFCSGLTTVFLTATFSKVNLLQLLLQGTSAIAKEVAGVSGILTKNTGVTVVDLEPQIGKV